MVSGNGRGRDVSGGNLGCQVVLYFTFRLLGCRDLRSGEAEITRKDRKELLQCCERNSLLMADGFLKLLSCFRRLE